MKVLPAIDIRDGGCVRLLQGKRGTETVYGEDPLEIALEWERQGAEWLHVVDLDAAFQSRSANRSVIEQIVARVHMQVQIGGGVRSFEDFQHWIDRGAARVVFGTAAVEDPAVLHRALRTGADKVAVGVDVKGGVVAVRGWEETSTQDPVCFGRRWTEDGVETFIYTDVRRDGSLEGPNVEAIRHFARETRASVIASGGVGSVEDLRRLRELEADGVDGVIVGRALYVGAFTLRRAKDVLEHGAHGWKQV
jgi:phosphoribosylformimino-5-aminoimidazole carboxamide ribotide isomerase